MSAEFEVTPIEPNKYHGLIFDMPIEQIPIRLAREVYRVGSMSLWEYQSFLHHDHPAMTFDEIEFELVQANEWQNILSAKFPDYRFVIEIRPLRQVTWFQALGNAPTTDEQDWKPYVPPVTFDLTKLAVEVTGSDEVGSMTSEQKELMKLKLRERMNPASRRDASVRVCDKCDSSRGFSDSFADPVHRGLLLMTCLECGATLIHSTRVIRNCFGPEKQH